MQKISQWKMLLSHHPPCEPFVNHTFEIKSIQFCIGCFIGYPSMGFGIVSSYFISIQGILDANILLFLGLGLLSLQWLSLFPITERKGVKMIQKASIGFGAGLIFLSAYILIKGSIILKIILLMAIFIGGHIPLQVLHMKKSKQVCNGCKDKWDLDVCPTDVCFADTPENLLA